MCLFREYNRFKYLLVEALFMYDLAVIVAEGILRCKKIKMTCEM